ncbi:MULTISPECIES: FAD-dependent oxidoreductase [Aphanizomenonaceae]|uniref:FAD-dependent oxidoreductase n=1 Tax=Dolichospermum heterosporum TAC447 TaxID=747523 RepID=A0ABY5LT32_9CYAN|nr:MULTISPECIES: FAD-dependent oxidoreductase [Aphanizomenonaceae]MBE9258302.1 FAD-dependent oxidoreductase [Dolichospermum sp. LEGE 00246]UUO15146.1 FAD-dependent oxidoreductase [Dolichospermum heterosporum TAC447]
MNQIYTTDVLVVGGGTGGTAAAIQAARRGVNTILVSEFPWLGGMLTSAGVSAPDGNELQAWQTGLWGAFLQELQRRQPGGLDNSWVSFFTYDPRIGAEIFADWVRELPNLQWISGQVPLEVLRTQERITGIRFANFTINAKIILDGTELGDLLALGEIPHRWGWELQSEWQEPSAPTNFNSLTQTYPVQAPTWVVVMQDFGENTAPEILPAPNYNPSQFTGAWDNYGSEKFLNYGRLPANQFMINWPIAGNDYCENANRLLDVGEKKREFMQESYWHSQNFAHHIQSQFGRRYGLAENLFPHPNSAFALHPYYRESRRLVGLTTVCERDILPLANGKTALPFHDAIAVGNYANDHHYPGVEFSLQPKSIRWGGRWTGTPFTIPYRALVPATTDGLLVCEKNISVSHIANGATRLQPVVMGIGQAAGMAASLCIVLECQPRDLPVKSLQAALLTDDHAPSVIVPLFNLLTNHPDWLYWQTYYLDHPEAYPADGNCPCIVVRPDNKLNLNCFTGKFQRLGEQNYQFNITNETNFTTTNWQLVALIPDIDQQLQALPPEKILKIWGRPNLSGNWLLVEYIEEV